MSRNFFDLDEFPTLAPLVKCATGVWDEVKVVDLYWMAYGADHEEHLTGKWWTAMVYRRDSVKSKRRRKPRPDMDNDEMRRVFRAMRELPEKIPGLTGWFDTFPAINFVGISRMPRGSRLAPHRHYNPDSLVLHVALDVPEDGSGIMVGDETRTWRKPGEYVIFDDSLVHSAWNEGDRERIVLHVDFERMDA